MMDRSCLNNHPILCSLVIVFLLVLLPQDSGLAQAGLQRTFQLNIKRNEQKQIKLSSNEAEQEVQGKIDGALLIELPESNYTKHRLILRDITGEGTISISGKYAMEIVLSSVSLGSLSINIDEIQRLVSQTGNLRLRQFDLRVNKLGLLRIESGSVIEELILGLGEESNLISFLGIVFRRLEVYGTKGKKAHIKSCQLYLPVTWPIQEPQIGPYCVAKLSALELSSLEVSGKEMQKSTTSTSNQSLSKTVPPNTILRMENLTVTGRGVVISMARLPNPCVELREIAFNDHIAQELVIENLETLEKFDTLVLAGISGVGHIRLEFPLGIRNLVLRNLEARFASINLPLCKVSEVERFEAGGIHLLDGMDAPSATLVSLAKINSSSRPSDRDAFFDCIFEHAFHELEDGTVDAPGLDVLEEHLLYSLKSRGLLEYIFGYLLWLLTGFGCSLMVPLATWLFVHLPCGFYYALSLDKAPVKKRIRFGLETSFVFALSFGFPSDKALLSRLEAVKPEAKSLVRKLAHFQGIESFLQLTLLTIYFSQTTLR